MAIQPFERFTALNALNDPWLKDIEQVHCQNSSPQEDALRPDIASKRANQNAQATQLLLENGFDIYAVNFNANMALL
jgi:hypothetical protein